MTAISMNITNDKAFGAVGCSDGSVVIMDLLSFQTVVQFSVGSCPIAALGFSPDDSILGVGNNGGILSLWNCQERRQVASYPLDSSLKDIVWQPEGQYVACLCDDSTATVFTRGKGNHLTRESTFEYHISCLAIIRNAPGVVLGTEDGRIVIWDATEPTEIPRNMLRLQSTLPYKLVSWGICVFCYTPFVRDSDLFDGVTGVHVRGDRPLQFPHIMKGIGICKWLENFMKANDTEVFDKLYRHLDLYYTPIDASKGSDVPGVTKNITKQLETLDVPHMLQKSCELRVTFSLNDTSREIVVRDVLQGEICGWIPAPDCEDILQYTEDNCAAIVERCVCLYEVRRADKWRLPQTGCDAWREYQDREFGEVGNSGSEGDTDDEFAELSAAFLYNGNFTFDQLTQMKRLLERSRETKDPSTAYNLRVQIIGTGRGNM